MYLLITLRINLEGKGEIILHFASRYFSSFSQYIQNV